MTNNALMTALAQSMIVDIAVGNAQLMITALLLVYILNFIVPYKDIIISIIIINPYNGILT